MPLSKKKKSSVRRIWRPISRPQMRKPQERPDSSTNRRCGGEVVRRHARRKLAK